MLVCVLTVLLVGLEIGATIHMFDTPEERYLKLVKVCNYSTQRCLCSVNISLPPSLSVCQILDSHSQLELSPT